MQKEKKDSVLASLRSRVWLSVCALAVANFLGGAAVYFAVSYIFSESTIPVAAALAAIVTLTVAYGRWLSDDLMRPIEKVNLAARSLERNADAPLPSTTGSIETDELLNSLHRNAKQLSNILMLMESVAAGKTATATVPLENTDRLSSAFQKLVAKVTDSIDAKNELDDLRTSLSRLTNDIEHAVRANTPIEIRHGNEKAAGIASAFNTVIQRSESISHRLRSVIGQANSTLSTVRDRVSKLREAELPSAEALNKLIATLKQTPDRIGQLKEESLSIPAISGDALNAGSEGRETQIITRKLNAIRASANDLQRRLRNVRERTHQLPQVSRLADDLSRRSKMVALNASIRSGTGAGNGSSPISDDFTELSERAVRLQRDLSGIDKAIVDDLTEVEPVLESILTEATEALLNATAAGELISKLEPAILSVSDLPDRVSALSEAEARDRENIMRQLTALYFERNNSVSDLNETEQLLLSVCEVLRELQMTEAAATPMTPMPAGGAAEMTSSEPGEYHGTASESMTAQMLDLPGEN